MCKENVLIVGSGIGGSMIANLLQDDFIVTLITKRSINDSNSMLAQGGIASAYDPKDSPEAHFEDSLIAGSYHNDKNALNELVHEGPKVIQYLIDKGIKFDKKPDGNYSYGLEGAHKIPRILHIAGDQTGEKMTLFVQSLIHNVNIIENTELTELLVKNNRCYGVKVLNENGEISCIYADYVILATGGIGSLYPITSNNATVTGDGIAIAKLAGCELKDMEFIQFHPTLLSIDNHCYGLISEAVRGEGAVLIREDGTRILKGKHPFEDLAPRDFVSQVLESELRKGNKIFLDISKINNFSERFPGITRNLNNRGIKFEETKRIPVQPGAHFFMGGIKTDLSAETNIKNLFAVGETACTGVHGANRLASNSLLEGLVFAKNAATEIKRRSKTKSETDLKNLIAISTVENEDMKNNIDLKQKYLNHLNLLPDSNLIKEKVWDNLGIMRSTSKIKTLINWLEQFDFMKPIDDDILTSEILERRNLCIVAYTIAKAALERKESLGSHFIEK